MSTDQIYSYLSVPELTQVLRKKAHLSDEDIARVVAARSRAGREGQIADIHDDRDGNIAVTVYTASPPITVNGTTYGPGRMSMLLTEWLAMVKKYGMPD